MKVRLAVVLCFMMLVSAVPVAAQGVPATCFHQTGYCITGRFREYWSEHGGLPVFGYPITAEFVDDEGITVQWFERTVFEWTPQNARPYDVSLFRMGDIYLLDVLEYDWVNAEREQPQPGCLFFKETGYNLCENGPAGGATFLTYWRTHGLEFDGRAGKSYGESLALFGMPLTIAYMDKDEQGRDILVQWFERTVFEYHPHNPPGQRILLGRLGAEYYDWLG